MSYDYLLPVEPLDKNEDGLKYETFDSLREIIKNLKKENKELNERNQKLKLIGWQTVSAYYEKDNFQDKREVNFDFAEAYSEFSKDLSFEMKPDFTEYAKNLTTKTEKIKNLQKLIDTFITHSNGLSIWVRLSHYKERLPKDLADDIQDLYDYQCHVEDELNKFGDQNDKDSSIH